MENVKSTLNLSAIISIVLVGLTTGCASNQPKESIEKPAELVQAMDQISSEKTIEFHQPSGSRKNAFQISGKADAAYEKEDWKAAEKYYRVLTLQVPQDSYGYTQLGNVLMRQRRVDDAIEAYNEALKRDPSDTRSLKNRALAYLSLAENSLEHTAGVLSNQKDPAADSYLVALMKLQRINGMALSETISPVQGLYLDQSSEFEETYDAAGQ